MHETWQLNPSNTKHFPDNLIIFESTRDLPTHTVNIHVSAICVDGDAVVSVNPDLLLVLVTHREIRDVLPTVYVIPRCLGYTSKDPCLKEQLPLLGEVEFSSHRAFDRHRISGWCGLWVATDKRYITVKERRGVEMWKKHENYKCKCMHVCLWMCVFFYAYMYIQVWLK